jgi:hypothetical protein
MSHSSSKTARVVSVASGMQETDRPTPVRDGRHQEPAVLIGNWINEGATVATADTPTAAILTSDVYEWVPGGFFVVHTAFGKIGDTSVGGVSIIGVDGDAYHDTFYDSFGNVHRSRLEIDGDAHRWIGVDNRTRCTVTMTDGGMTQVAHHESSVDGVTWTASMDVVLRKCG